MKYRFFIIILLLGAIFVGWRAVKNNANAEIVEKPTLRKATPPGSALPASSVAQRTARAAHEKNELAEELNSRKNERIVTFKNEKAYRDAITNLEKNGFRILGRIDGLRALRVGYDNLSQLQNALGDEAEMGRNFLVTQPPEGEVQAGAAGFGNDYLAFLGIKGDISAWGSGVTIAILDSGVVAHPSIPADFIQISLVDSNGEPNGHGTAVASLASAVAPAAKILSVQIADASGMSDSFTLAQGIFTALENGAQVINISMGAQYESPLVAEAIAAAQAKGAVIVASSGNNGLDYATSPASNKNVISVGAIDANSNYLEFSNRYENLSTSAPGYEVYAAWPGDLGIAFTGTSASSPLTAGGVAAVMSQLGGDATQAAQILLSNSNEAGQPGSDSLYGQGTLDIGRAVNSSTGGISDLAVASHTYSLTGNSGLQISVENRGTETLLNSTVNVTIDGQNYRQNIGKIDAAERQIITIPTGLTKLQSGGSLSVISSVSVASGVNDSNSANNSRADVITLSSTKNP